MNRREFVFSTFAGVVGLSEVSRVAGQAKTITPDLGALAEKKSLKLRTDQPGKFEQAVNPVPDPNAWFRARVVIANPKASVFVGDAKDPCLSLNLLNDSKKGLVGLWAGNNSGGDFANLTIVPAA